jgi:hypothetical protein
LQSLRLGVVACVLAIVAIAAPAQAASQSQDHLDMYRATVGGAQAIELARKGVDVSARRDLADGNTEVDLVLTPKQRAALAADGVDATLIRVKGGKTVKQFAAAQAAAGYNVWRDYDGPDGLEAYMRQIARDNPQLLKLEKLGQT